MELYKMHWRLKFPQNSSSKWKAIPEETESLCHINMLDTLSDINHSFSVPIVNV